MGVTGGGSPFTKKEFDVPEGKSVLTKKDLVSIVIATAIALTIASVAGKIVATLTCAVCGLE